MVGDPLQLEDGRSLSFTDLGRKSGTPLFQLHGTPGSRVTGAKADDVESSGWRLITPDRPGYGFSTVGESPSFEGFADDIRQLADHLGIEQFHVLGVSGGGPFALACAAHLQRRVLSATLVSTATPSDRAGFSRGMCAANRLLFWTATRHPRVLKGLCDAYARAMRWQASALEVEPFRQGGAGMVADLQLLSRPWGIPTQAILCPIYLWHGENDAHSPVDGARWLARQLPTCEAHFLPGRDHFLHRDPLINADIEACVLGRSTG